jgi:hypothetical protein
MFIATSVRVTAVAISLVDHALRRALFGGPGTTRKDRAERTITSRISEIER